MPKGPKPSEQRIVLDKISWQRFETLLAEMGEERTARFTYDRGRLEMMTPLDEHERCHKLIESLILVLADELQLQVEGYKSPLLLRPDLQLVLEPDTGYYIQHAAQMHNRGSIDLGSDPPPDLVLEVTLNKSTINRLPLYAELGVPELWNYTSQPGDEFFKGKLVIYCLEAGRYVPVKQGYAFPFLSADRILQFIDQSDTLGLMSALRTLREWVQGQQ